ncbi:hypothetical protein niasHS_000321 [Heterodera schachtii]|uniref:Uncharacterized protein n=1 Tax=Heterodera schachtii TaxID=97005 RepID=A0ABD2KI60_HETSC
MIEPRTSLIKFAAELFNIKTEFVQCIVLTRADKREKLIMELRKADFNGVKIWSKMDTKPKVNLNQNWWEFVLDMPFDTEFGGTNSVVELNKQINDDFRPNLSKFGPGLVVNRKFYPISGIMLEGVLDIYDKYREFWWNIEKENTQIQNSKNCKKDETKLMDLNEEKEKTIEFFMETDGDSIEFETESEFFQEEQEKNSAKRADGRLKLTVKANANQNRVLAIKGVVKFSAFIAIFLLCQNLVCGMEEQKKMLNESILDESDDDVCVKSNEKAEKVSNAKRRKIVYECHECQPSTSAQSAIANQMSFGIENIKVQKGGKFNETGAEIGGLVQANPQFVSQLATVAGQLLGTALKEERNCATPKFARGRGRGHFFRGRPDHWRSPPQAENWRSFPPPKWQNSTDQSDRQAQDLARTAAEAMHELANHIRQQNPDLAAMFFAIEAALTEVCQNRWHK